MKKQNCKGVMEPTATASKAGIPQGGPALHEGTTRTKRQESVSRVVIHFRHFLGQSTGCPQAFDFKCVKSWTIPYVPHKDLVRRKAKLHTALLAPETN